MRPRQKVHRVTLHRVLVLLMCSAVPVGLRAQAALTITSPAEGAVVHPGDTVTVTVSATGASFAQMIVVAQDPIRSSQVLTAPPYQFSIQIPSNITPGSYAFSASGAVSPGNGIESDPVSIDVERVDQPVSITAEPTSLTLAIGERVGLRVVGKYSDNSTVDITQSTQTTYLSQNSAIANVSNDGFVTGVASGFTRILIGGTITVSIVVQPPVTIAPGETTVTASQTRQFVATTSDDQPVVWSVSPDGAGSVDANGLYTAPSLITSQQTVTIMATSVSDNTQVATAMITLSPAASVTVTPSWTTLYPAQSQQFTAITSNIGNAGVLWSISPTSAGTIDASGLYTAPSSITSLQSVTITAKSVSTSSILGAVTTWLSPQPFTLFSYSPTSIAVAQSSTNTISINVMTANSFGHPVVFSAIGLPSGITTSFDPPTLVGLGITTLTLSPTTSVPPGSYNTTITATDSVYPTLTASLPLNVIVQTPQGTSNSSTSLSAGWTAQDIGYTGLPGSTQVTNSVYQLSAAGVSIRGSSLVSESFHFAYTGLFGDGTLVARLAAQQQGEAGITIRDSLDAGSKYATLSAAVFAVRTATGDDDQVVSSNENNQAPLWLKLVRQGNVFTASTSQDGILWNSLGQPQTIAMGTNVYAGVAADSGSNSYLSTTYFDNVTATSSLANGFALSSTYTPFTKSGYVVSTGYVNEITTPGFNNLVQLSAAGAPSGLDVQFQPATFSSNGNSAVIFTLSTGLPSGIYPITITGTSPNQDVSITVPLTVLGALPQGWSSADIGFPALGQSGTIDQSFVLQGSGTGPDYTVDQMQYAYTQLTGDGTVTARLTSLQKESLWAQAGIMLRASTDQGALSVSLEQSGSLASNRNEWGLFCRVDTNGDRLFSYGGGGQHSFPVWFQIQRHGNAFTGFVSTDAMNWTQIYSCIAPLPTTVLAGMFAAMDDGSKLATAMFDNFSVSNAFRDFSLATSSVTVGPGSIATAPVSASFSDLFPDTVSLSINGLPSGVTAMFSLSSLAGSSNISTLTLTASPATVAGTYPVTIIGTSGTSGITHSITFSLTVQGFLLKTSKAVLLAQRGSTAKTNVTETASHGFSNSVLLSLTGLPTGITAAFSPGALSGSASSTLTFTVSSSASGGSYPLVITGADSISGLSISIPITLAVQNQSLSVPASWINTDVGPVGKNGSTAAGNGLFTIKGSGWGLTGNSDQGQFAFTLLQGDGFIVVRLVNVQDSVGGGSQAGIAFRSSLNPGSPYTLLYVSGGNAMLSTRSLLDAQSDQPIASATSQFPQWLKLSRQGPTVSGFTSSDGVNWTTIGSINNIDLGTKIYAGLAVSSTDNGSLAIANFDNVLISSQIAGIRVEGSSYIFVSAPSSGTVNTSQKLFECSTPGLASNVSFNVSGLPSGVTASLSPASASGSGTTLLTLTILPTVQEGSYPITVTGIDQSSGATDSWSTTLAIQSQNGSGSSTPTLPSGWFSSDIGAIGIPGQSFSGSGLITVQGTGTNVSGTEDQLQFAYTAINGDGSLVARLLAVQDSGNSQVGIMLRDSLDPQAAYAFLFVQGGNATLRVRTALDQQPNDLGGIGSQSPQWLKLLRQGDAITGYTSPDGINWTPVGTAFLTMTATAYAGIAVSANDNGTMATANFDNVSVATSSSGFRLSGTNTLLALPPNGSNSQATLNLIATTTPGFSDRLTLSVTGLPAGITANFSPVTLTNSSASVLTFAVSSGTSAGSYPIIVKATDQMTGSAVSWNTILVIQNPSGPLPDGWQTADIGSVGAPGQSGSGNGVFTVAGSGTGVSGNQDGFRFTYTPFLGDGSIVVRLLGIQSPYSATQVGIMIRDTLAIGARTVMLATTDGLNLLASYRSSMGGYLNTASGLDGSWPQWLKLVREGNKFSAFVSRDGSTWIALGSSLSTTMATNVYAGLIVSSANDGYLSTAVFDNVSAVSSNPQISLSTSPPSISTAAGGNASSDVSIMVNQGYTSSVTFGTTSLPSGVTASFSPKTMTGSGSATLTLSTSGSASPRSIGLNVTAASGSLTVSTPLSFAVSEGFSLSNSGNFTITAGSSSSNTITLAANASLSSSVSLSVGGLPSGVNGTFSVPMLNSPGTSKLTLTSLSTIPGGTYPITVTGTSSTLSRTTTFNLVVKNFSLALSNGSVAVAHGGSSGTTTVQLTVAGGFASTVTFGSSGLPTGTSASFSPTSANSNGMSSLTILAGANAAPGTYNVTVKGTSGSLVQTTPLVLTVN